jgi:fatty acid desaturase
METSDRSPSLLIDILRKTIADLETVNPWIGLWRIMSLGWVTLSLVTLAWSADSTGWFLFYTAIAAFPYAFCFICTHDAVHHTLTGWAWFDDLIPHLLAYPMMWPHGVYRQLHRLHHAWNGINLRDPERVQWTIDEYQQANLALQWYVRHQWLVDLFVLGGVGMIVKTVMKGFQLQSQLPALRGVLLRDGLGILGVQILCVSIALRADRMVDYVLFWFVLERIMGVIIQARDHLEHYGLWGQTSGHQLTQLYASRNLCTPKLVSWCMGGLNYHSVHHAFPGIPFNHLAMAEARIQAVLKQQHQPSLVTGVGYVQETLHLGTHPLLIGPSNPEDATGRNHMLPLSDV